MGLPRRATFSFSFSSLALLFLLAFTGLISPAIGKHVQHNNNNNNHHYHHHNHHHHQPHRRDVTATRTQECEPVRADFQAWDIKLNENDGEKGAICGGVCCTNATEQRLREHATNEFESVLRYHTKSLHGNVASMAHVFQTHLLELVDQSENRTLTVFSKVYSRMEPLSRQLVQELFSEIRNSLNALTETNIAGGNANKDHLEMAMRSFFVQLFPLAYHQALHSNPDATNNHKSDAIGDLHEDFIACLERSYDEVQPFGDIPQNLLRLLQLSVQTAHVFESALLQSKHILGEMESMYGSLLSPACHTQLLRMRHCASCNGHRAEASLPCHSFCLNVLRGCSAPFASVLDRPWSSVVDAIDQLVMNHLRAENGVIEVLKHLDTSLSKAIIFVMTNQNEKELKVLHACGKPRFMPLTTSDVRRNQGLHPDSPPTPHQPPAKWVSPIDTGILQFLSTLDKSKDFFTQIVDNVCSGEDDLPLRDDHCWTGDRMGEYAQVLMTSGSDKQRYNPEVPLHLTAEGEYTQIQLNGLADRLLRIRQSISNTIPSMARPLADIQNDMAHHYDTSIGRTRSDDLEGSGRGMSAGRNGHYDDDDDDGIYDGSGSEGSGHSTPPQPDVTLHGAYPPPIDVSVIEIDSKEDRSSGNQIINTHSIWSIVICTLLIAGVPRS